MRETAEKCARRVVRDEILERLLSIDEQLRLARERIILQEIEDATSS